MKTKALRYFISDDLTAQSDEATLSGEELKHFSRVNRLGEGDSCFLINGKGVLAKAIAKSVDRKAAVFSIDEVKEGEKFLGPEIILGQAISRKGIFGSIVEKAVELNVSKVIPILADRNVVKVSSAKEFQEKHQAHADQALKQCHRLIRMEVDEPKTVKELDSVLEDSSLKLILDPQEGKPIHEVLSKLQVNKIFVAIGPEGGFSDEEERQFETYGFSKVNLPGNVLRSETASVSILSLLRFGIG